MVCYNDRIKFLDPLPGNSLGLDLSILENENPIRTLGDYSIPSHEGYRNTIELPDGNKVVPLRSDTIRLVQNGCSFHRLRSEDPNQHLKDFLKLLDSLDLDVANRERTLLHLKEFFDYVGITHQISVPYSPEQKGVVERQNRTLMEASRVFVGYSSQVSAFRIYNQRTRKIMETIHITFDEIQEMTSNLLKTEPKLNQKTSRQSSSELLPTQRLMSPNSAATLLQNPQDDIPSLVLGSSTPILGAAESTLDTPLVSQESL
ncbi:MAK10-like protein [Tanacetum coccineum]